ncbi:MAG: hypothetical protein U0470_10485 [Anaerolineae bacterium]
MSHLTSTQRSALVTAGALSAFTLVLIGAVAGRIVRDDARVASATVTAVPPTAAPTAGADPAVQALLDRQGTAYEQVIQEANDRLARANDQLKAAYAAAAAASTAAARPAAPPAPAYVGPEAAAQVALGAAQGAIVLQAPELVNFQGTAAYEVVTNAGSIYVDALSGRLLFSGAASSAANGGGGGGGGGGRERGEHEGGEHEGGDDREDHDG